MKGKLAKGLAIGVGVLLVLTVTVGGWGLYAIDALLDDICADEVLTVARSPDGVNVASAVVRNCGATTSYVLAVVLHEYGDGLPNDLGSAAVYLVNGQGPVTLHWVDDTHLSVVIVRAQGSSFRKAPLWRNIDIKYSYGE